MITYAHLQLTRDVYHEEIHMGSVFDVVGEVTLNASSSHVLAISIPVNKELHFKPMRASSREALTVMRLREAGTFTGGTPATPFNRKRNHSDVSAATVKTGVTMVGTGTVIDILYAGTGGNPASGRGGTGAGANEEIILKGNTTYLIEIVNVGSVSTTMMYGLTWYEVIENAVS